MIQDIARFLPESERDAIAVRAVEKVRNSDIPSRSTRMRQIREIERYFRLEAKPKSFPFNGCANIMAPLLTAPTIQHQSRLFDMIYSGTGRIAYVVSPSYYKAGEKELAERFFNHYLIHEMPELPMGLDASLMQTTKVGSSFRRTIWDHSVGRCRSEWIPIADFVAPNGIPSKDPSMSDMPRYAIIKRMSLRQVQAKKEWVDTDKLHVVNIEEPDVNLGAESDHQTVDPDADLDSPRIIIEYYFRYLAPDRKKKAPELDGMEHPAYAWIDMEQQKLLYMCYREEDDPDDFERYAKDYTSWRVADSLHEDAERAYKEGGLTDKPIKPDISEPRQRKREVPLCTHYSACPSEGFYGLGIGDFLLGLNKAMNTIINQSLDAGTMRIARPGFISRQMRGPRGAVQTMPGHLIEVDAPMGALRDGVYYPEMPPGDPFMQYVIETVRNMSQGIVGSFDTMSGRIPGSNQAGSAVLALIEQANMPVTVMAKRTRESFRHELEKIWRCLGTFLPDKKVVDMIGADASVMQVQVGRHLFGPDTKIFPLGDARAKSERISDAQAKLASVLQNPLVQMGMQTGQPAAHELVKYESANLFRAMGDERAAMLVEQIQSPPPPPQGPPPGQRPPGGPPPGRPPGPPQGPPPAGAQNSTMPGRMG